MSADESRDTFADLLARATEDPPADLVDRMRSFTALADTAPPPRRRLPRAGTLALVAASLALVVGAAVFVGARGSDGPAAPDPAEPAAVDGNYLPREWPEVLDSAVGTRSFHPSDERPDSESWLVAADGVAAAQLVAFRDAGGEAGPSDMPSEPGDGTWWTDWFQSDGWWGAVVGRGIDTSWFPPPAVGSLGRGLELDEDRLAPGWTVIDDPEGVLTAAFTGSPLPRTRTAVATRTNSTGVPTASVMTIRVDDAEAALATVASLAAKEPHLDLGGGVPALLVDHVSSLGFSIVWSPEPGIVVVAAATVVEGEESASFSDADLLAVARSSRPVSAATWERLTPPGTRELPEATCRALDARPAGLGPVSDRNGVTQLGGSWIQVLGEDLFRLTTGDRQRVADAVRADREGFDRILEELTESERAPLITMRTVALEPERIDEHVADDEVRSAAFLVTRLGRSGCGFA